VTSKVARRLDIMTGHSPFSSYSAYSPLDKSTFSNLVPSSFKIQVALVRNMTNMQKIMILPKFIGSVKNMAIWLNYRFLPQENLVLYNFE